MSRLSQQDRQARMEELVTLFNRAPMKKTFGMTLSYDQDERAVFEMPYHPGFDHALAGIHGGVFATLLDNAGWFTAAVHYDSWIATVEFQTRLLEPVQKEDLVAQGELIRIGKNLSVAKMEVRTAQGALAATGTGTYAAIPKVSLS